MTPPWCDFVGESFSSKAGRESVSANTRGGSTQERLALVCSSLSFVGEKGACTHSKAVAGVKNRPAHPSFLVLGGGGSSTYMSPFATPDLVCAPCFVCGCRVCFCGHSMGGGIAAMASMLIRDSASRRGQQHRRSAADSAPPRGSSSAAETVAGAAGATAAPGAAAAGGIAAGMSGETATGLGLRSALTVYSFATPSCVSLELARGCEGWVESIVHGDDAIPRLSTVSLELLKEDMTGTSAKAKGGGGGSGSGCAGGFPICILSCLRRLPAACFRGRVVGLGKPVLLFLGVCICLPTSLPA